MQPKTKSLPMTNTPSAVHQNLSSHPKLLSGIDGYPFPVGVEYYRAPVPERAYWAEDFKQLAQAGFRIVRAFHPWNWVEAAPGVFYFDDLDELFDLAAENGLKIWLDTPVGTHMACPEWILDQHPDMRVERYTGSMAYPRARNYAAQGGMIHNFDHPMWRVYVERYIRALVGRYKDHPAMHIWGTWDGINFAAAWTGGDGYPPYNDYTVTKYIAWLKERYTLEQLNDRLLRRYASWEDVTAPRDNAGVVEMLLYRRFHYENCADHLGWLADLIDQIDGQHEQRSHGACFPRQFDTYCSPRVDGWGLSHNSSNLLRITDPDHRVADVCLGYAWARSVGANHRWWTEEIYSNFVGGICQPGFEPRTLPEEAQTFTWLSLIYGAAGAMFWQYRPEYMTFEAPGLNLTSLDGRPTKRFDAVAKTIRDIQKIRDHLPLPAIEPGQVATVYDPTNHDIFMCGANENGYLESIRVLHRSLWPKNIDQNIVTIKMDLSPYKVVYLPHFIRHDETSAQKIRDLVQRPDGPLLIADGHFGTFAHRGHWSYQPPERLDDLLPVRVDDFGMVLPSTLEQYPDRAVFNSVYGDFPIETPCQYAILKPMDGTEVVGTIDGHVVAVRCPQQRFIWFGFPLSALTKQGAIPDALLHPLLDIASIAPPIAIEGDPLAAFERKSKLGGKLIFLLNLHERTAHSRVLVAPAGQQVTDLLAGQELTAKDGAFSVTLEFGQVTVIHCPEETM